MQRESHIYRNCGLLYATCILVAFMGVIIAFINFSNFKIGALLFIAGLIGGLISNFIIRNNCMRQEDFIFSLEDMSKIKGEILEACSAAKYKNKGNSDTMVFEKQKMLGGETSSVSVYSRKISKKECQVSVWGSYYVSKRWTEMAKCKDIILNTIYKNNPKDASFEESYE